MPSQASSPSTHPPPAHGQYAGASPLDHHDPPSLFDNISPVLFVLAIVFAFFTVSGVSYLLIRKWLRAPAKCIDSKKQAKPVVIPVIVITPPSVSEISVSLVTNEEELYYDEYDDAEKGQPHQKCAGPNSMVRPIPTGDASYATNNAKGPPITPEELEEIRLGDALLDEACLYAYKIVKLRNAARRGFFADAARLQASERYDTVPLPIKEVSSKLVQVQSETEIAKAHACAEEAEVTLPQPPTEGEGEMEMQSLLFALGLVDTNTEQETEPTTTTIQEDNLPSTNSESDRSMNSLSSDDSSSDPWYTDLFISPEEETGRMKFDDAIPSSDCLRKDSDTSMEYDTTLPSLPYLDRSEIVPPVNDSISSCVETINSDMKESSVSKGPVHGEIPQVPRAEKLEIQQEQMRPRVQRKRASTVSVPRVAKRTVSHKRSSSAKENMPSSVLSATRAASVMRKKSGLARAVPLRDFSNIHKSSKTPLDGIPEFSAGSSAIVTALRAVESAQPTNQLSATKSVSGAPLLVVPLASGDRKPLTKHTTSSSTQHTAGVLHSGDSSVNASAENSLPGLSRPASAPTDVPILKLNDDQVHVDADVLISQPDAGLKHPHPRPLVRPQPSLLNDKWTSIGHPVLITVRIKSLNGIHALTDPLLANVHFEDVHTFPVKIHTKTPLKAFTARVFRVLGTPPALRGAVNHPNGRISFVPFLREEDFAEWLAEREKSGYVGVVDCWPLKPRSYV